MECQIYLISKYTTHKLLTSFQISVIGNKQFMANRKILFRKLHKNNRYEKCSINKKKHKILGNHSNLIVCCFAKSIKL